MGKGWSGIVGRSDGGDREVAAKRTKDNPLERR